MAKRTKRRSRTTARTTTKRAQTPALPGLEHHAIRPLETLAQEYAGLRDQRMELTRQEHALKVTAIKLMHKYDKTVYHHDGVTITLTEIEDVKVRVRSTSDAEDGDASDADAGDEARGAAFADERTAAVEGDE